MNKILRVVSCVSVALLVCCRGHHSKVTIRVNSSRPVASLVDEVERRYGVRISYSEAPGARSQGWRRHPPAAFDADLPDKLDQESLRDGVSKLVRATPGGESFHVIESKNVLAVVEDDKQQPSVRVARKRWNGLELIKSIREQLGSQVCGTPIPASLIVDKWIDFGESGSVEQVLLDALGALGLSESVSFRLERTFDGQWSDLSFFNPQSLPVSKGPVPNGETTVLAQWQTRGEDLAKFLVALTPADDYSSLVVSEAVGGTRDDCYQLASNLHGKAGLLAPFCGGQNYSFPMLSMINYSDFVGEACDYSAYYMQYTGNQSCKIVCSQDMSYSSGVKPYAGNVIEIDLAPGTATICRGGMCITRP